MGRRLQLRRAGNVPVATLPRVTAREVNLRRAVVPLVTEESAMGVSAFRRGIRLISRTVGMLPLELYRGEVELEETTPLLDKPVPWMSRQAAVESMVESLILYGNYFAVLTQFDALGRAQGLIPIHPFHVAVSLTNDGLVYLIGYEQFGSADVLHLRTGGRAGELLGQGVLETSPTALNNAINVDSSMSFFYGPGAYPTGVLTADDPDMTQDEADDLRLNWISRVRRGEPVVVPTGVTWNPMASPTAEEMQLEAASRMSRLQIADVLDLEGDWLGVPSKSMTYKNISDRFDDLITLTCQPWMSCIEQGFTDLTSRPTNVRFDVDEFLRGTTAERWANYAVGIGSGFLLRNEARAEEGMDPVPGLDDDPEPLPAPEPPTPADQAQADPNSDTLPPGKES
jgi:HK97 family phage portal protein